MFAHVRALKKKDKNKPLFASMNEHEFMIIWRSFAPDFLLAFLNPLYKFFFVSVSQEEDQLAEDSEKPEEEVEILYEATDTDRSENSLIEGR